MVELVFLTLSLLMGGMVVWTVARLTKGRVKAERHNDRLLIRAQILNETVKKDAPPNTAREVGEALFGPEEKGKL